MGLYFDLNPHFAFSLVAIGLFRTKTGVGGKQTEGNGTHVWQTAKRE
jgi:hypothetical protein